MATGVSVYALVSTIRNSEVRGAAIRLLLDLYRLGFELKVSVENPKKDMHFEDSNGVRPYSFIANKTIGLLFYFRKEAQKPGPDFPLPLEISKSDKVGEAKYRVNNEQQANEIIKFISRNRE